MRCAIHARVSITDQEPENQLQELRRYSDARGWTAVEYIDKGVSGSTDRRPSLDRMVVDAKQRRFDVLIVWRLDRLGRDLKHLVMLLEDLQAVGIAFVSLNEGIDCTTAAGRLQLHVLAALAEVERARIAERVKAGLERARSQGKRLARPRGCPATIAVPGGCACGGADMGRIEVNCRALGQPGWATSASCLIARSAVRGSGGWA